MPRSGFEPESLPREGSMIGRTTLSGPVLKKTKLLFKNMRIEKYYVRVFYFTFNLQELKHDKYDI